MVDPGMDPRVRAARSLGRASAITRGIGLLVMLGAFLFLLMALFGSTNSSDRTGFSLIALAVLLFATLVWASGVFHRVASQTLPTLVAVEERLARLESVMRSQSVAVPQAATEAPATPVVEEAAPQSAPRVAPRPPPPEPERVPCPLCGGLIHPEASRCVHCMKKLPRANTA